MTETSGQAQDRPFHAVVADRLFAGRWPLVVLAIVLLAIWGAGGLSAGVAAAAFVVVAVAAALAPRRPMATTEAVVGGNEGRSQLESLPAANLASAVPDAMVIVDKDGTTVHANEAAETAFGPFVIGLPLQRKFRTPEMQELIHSLLAGEAESAAVDYVERVPIERVYRVTAIRIRGDGELAVLVFKDQSETRRIDRMRADFIANASHELRTPLASIAGFVETLRGPARDDAAAREHFLKIMQEQTARMARLIDDLLSLSRLEMKPLLAQGMEVDLVLTVKSVIDLLGPMAREAGVKVVGGFPEETVIVAGSRDELFQVFENLLENACKYGQSGGRVVVTSQQARAGLRRRGDGQLPRFRPGHRRGTHSAHHRAVLSRRRRGEPRPEGHRPRPGDRQAHPDPSQRQAVDKVGGRQRV